MTSVLDIAKEINKKYKDNEVLIAGDMLPDTRMLSFGVLSADYPLKGGLPYGSIIEISGQFASGKTTLAALAVANWQRKNPDKVCIWVDVESSIKMQLPHFKKMTGLQTDEDHLLVYNCTGKSADSIFADIIDLQTQADNIGMIVVDSVAALVSDSDLESDFEKDNGMRATTAKSIGKFLRFIEGWLQKKNNILILINQTVDIGTTFTGAKIYDELRGKAMKFYPHVKIRCGTRTFIKDGKNDLSITKAEGATGYRINFNVMKSKISATNKGGGFVSFDYESGIDDIIDTIEVAIKCEFIRRPNNMTYIIYDLDKDEVMLDENGDELRFVGKPKLIDYIQSNPAFKETYFNMLSKHLNNDAVGVSLLEQEQLDEIQNEEENNK